MRVIVFDDFKSDTDKEVRGGDDTLLDTIHMPDLVNHNANTAMRSKRLARVIQDPNHPITSLLRDCSQTDLEAGKSLAQEIHRSLTTCPFGYGVESQLRQEARG